jgi:lysophospholipase L1-like esterase
MIVEDDDLFYRLKPGWRERSVMGRGNPVELSVNSDGFRDDEFSDEKRPNEVRIMNLGDSITFSIQLENEDGYPKQLQEILQRRYPSKKIVSMNLGILGYSSYQGMVLYDRLGERFHPDIITLCFLNNELTKTVMEDKHLRPRPRSWAERLAHRSQVYRFFTDVITRRRLNPPPGAMVVPHGEKWVHRVSPEDSRANLMHIITSARARGIPVIVIDPWSTDSPYTEPHCRYRSILRELPRMIPGVYLAGVKADFDKRPRVMETLMLDEFHPNPRGYREMARIIADVIVKERLITNTSP